MAAVIKQKRPVARAGRSSALDSKGEISRIPVCCRVATLSNTRYAADVRLASLGGCLSLTGRYTNSPETAFEFDLAQLRGMTSGSLYLNKLCETTLTNGY